MPYAPLPWTENPRGVGSVFDDSIPPVEDEPRKPREEPLRDDAFWNHEGVEAPPAFADNELVITYDWYGTGMYDLDTGTTFLGATFGYGCGGGAANDYCEWVGGDNTGLNGEEVVRVKVDKARRDGLWSGSVTIDLAAGWYSPAGGSGQANLSVTYRGRTQTKAISPGSQTACASTGVGTITVNSNGTFTLA